MSTQLEPANAPIIEINVDEIEPNPYQPRRVFNRDELEDLANSIREDGVLQNLVVRYGLTRFDGRQGYILIAGERRRRASQIAGLKTVPCRVLDVSKLKAGLLALVENVQRVDINPLEQGQFIAYLLQEAAAQGTKLTIGQVSQQFGKPPSWVSYRLKLVSYREDVREMVTELPDTMYHAGIIDKVSDADFRAQLIDETKNGASVARIQQRVKEGKALAYWQRETRRAPDKKTQSARDEHEQRDQNEDRVLDALAAISVSSDELRASWSELQQSQRRKLRAKLDEVRTDIANELEQLQTE